MIVDRSPAYHIDYLAFRIATQAAFFLKKLTRLLKRATMILSASIKAHFFNYPTICTMTLSAILLMRVEHHVF